MVTNFAGAGPDDPTSLVPCFKIEGSRIRLAVFTILTVEDVAVAEVDGAGSGRKTVGKSESATVD